jgi:hypothetical protein
MYMLIMHIWNYSWIKSINNLIKIKNYMVPKAKQINITTGWAQLGWDFINIVALWNGFIKIAEFINLKWKRIKLSISSIKINRKLIIKRKNLCHLIH